MNEKKRCLHSHEQLQPVCFEPLHDPSGGAISGIVIGAVAAVILFAGAAVLLKQSLQKQYATAFTR